MTMGSLTGNPGWLGANPEVFAEAARALVASAGAIQQVIARRDSAIQAITAGPNGWTGRASLRFADAWARRREELQRLMVTQQDASVVYQRFAATLTDAQQAWQRLTEQAVQAGATLNPTGTIGIPGPPAEAGLIALSDEVQAIRVRAEAITTEITDADRQAAAQLSELARRDPRPEVKDTTRLPVLLQAGMRGQITDEALPPGTDPAVVAAWFAALPVHVRQRLVRTAPNLIGNLNGLPPGTRDQANRLAIVAALPAARAAVETARGELAAARAQPALRDAEIAGRAEDIEGAEAQLADAEERVQTYEYLLALDDDRAILGFSPEGNGRAVVATGDITTASNLAVLVPGMDTTIDSISGQVGNADQIREEILDLFGREVAADTAMVSWIGYDAPQGLIEAKGPHHAQAAAPELANFTESLRTTNQGDPNIAVLGHSYGSSTVGLTAVVDELSADDVILIASPGAMAYNVDQYNLRPNAEVWNGLISQDLIRFAHVGREYFNTLDLGPPPGLEEFGARSFSVDPVWSLDAHSRYFDEGSTSLENISRIIANRSETVQ